MDIQIANLKKQNDGMENAFKNKNIGFTKLTIENVDPETELILLKDYNNYLKGISASNRPPPQEKPVKQEATKHEAPKKKEKTEDDDEDEMIRLLLQDLYNSPRSCWSWVVVGGWCCRSGELFVHAPIAPTDECVR